MRQRALSWLCATTALLALLSSCSKSKSAGESDNKAPAKPGSAEPAGAAPAAAGAIKLSVAAIPIVDVAPIYLGKAKGFFSEQNLDLTIQSVRGGAEAVPGVVSGQFQFAFANVISLLLAHSKGLPI